MADREGAAGLALLASPELPDGVTAVAPRVVDRVESFLRGEARRWASLDGAVAELIDALATFAVGGKALRPVFCFWAFVGAGGDRDDGAIVDAGAALELLHAGALVHDDVIDRSARRRGRPTIHVDFAERHRRTRGRGDSQHFGQAAGVLLGDLAFAYADQLIGLIGAASAPVRQVWNEMRVELNVGQVLDLTTAANAVAGDDLTERVRAVAVYKSAKYTVERPLHLGATLAGRPELAPALSAVGLPLGEAFQLRDDLLGAFGDPRATGKPVGDDFREGKMTALLAKARARSAADAAQLDRRLGRPDLSDDDVAAVQELITGTGARAEVERELEALVDQARAALARLASTGFDAGAADALDVLACFVAGRDR